MDKDLLNQAEIFKALGHPSRLAVVKELCRQDECCVCELQEAAGCGPSTLSRHLLILKNAGVLGCEKRGLNIYYRLKLPCLKALLDCLVKNESSCTCGCQGK